MHYYYNFDLELKTYGKRKGPFYKLSVHIFYDLEISYGFLHVSFIHYSYIGLSLVSFISEEELRRDLTCPGPATLGSEMLNLE